MPFELNGIRLVPDANAIQIETNAIPLRIPMQSKCLQRSRDFSKRRAQAFKAVDNQLSASSCLNDIKFSRKINVCFRSYVKIQIYFFQSLLWTVIGQIYVILNTN
jgi:hypothetical protein